MVSVRYEQQPFELADSQSVLECLTANGIAVPSSCRSGICQTCLMRATEGVPPAASQKGLNPTLVHQNYFLSCICYPTESLGVALPSADSGAATVPAFVRGLELLNPDIMRVVLECHHPIEYRAGQFIQLFRDESLGRSYSLASVPEQDDYLHLHVRRIPTGQTSGWVHEQLRPGHRVEIRGPAGNCFYVPGKPDQSLLLVGTGTGLAPLYGIIRDALAQGHAGPIHLFHGSRDRRGLYLERDLRDLERRFSNFHYVPCLSGDEVPKGHVAGRADQVALQSIRNLKDWRLFLCGHPDMVQSAKKKAFLAGASIKDIYADAFHVGQRR